MASDGLVSEVDGVAVLRRFFEEKAPVVAVLGQQAGWTERNDPVLTNALARLNRTGTHWRDILSVEPVPPHFYEWLSERFQRRLPSKDLETIASAPFSAVFTSSLDPGLANLMASDGREPDLVLLGTPQPRVLRSLRRPPVYYLFGRAGAAVAEMLPPISSQAVAQRRIRHATAMLRNVDETATVLGLIVVEGIDPQTDWLRTEDLIAVLSNAPQGSVLWCGEEPSFAGDDAAAYKHLTDSGIIVRDSRNLAKLVAEAKLGLLNVEPETWGEPELVTLSEGKQLAISSRVRLITQASATIIDDSWTGFLAPITGDGLKLAFHNFHGLLGGSRVVFDGVRRGFSVERDFEKQLWERVSKALSQHHVETAAIVLHGQSGVGKSIALARAALKARATGAAVLFAHGRLPQAGDISEFLQQVDQAQGVTLVVADCTVPTARYDDLLRALKSAGHRAVVLGSSYRIDLQEQSDRSRLIEAPALLSGDEHRSLMEVVAKYAPEAAPQLQGATGSEHALARFYRLLPESRLRISEGLGREARLTEHELRTRGARKRPVKIMSALGDALIAAGFGAAEQAPIPDRNENDIDTAAGKVIDYVMAASRLFKSIPVGLVLRAVSADDAGYGGAIDTSLIRDLFEGQDLFRWKYSDEEGSELLIGARLQIEAEIVCRRRLGGPRAEAQANLDLIRCAYRAGPEDNEETRFVAEMVQAMGPDGPAGDRYKDHYAELARSLTDLRNRSGVMNGRLMLQESALRRAYVRTHRDLSLEEKANLLVEATEAVDGALAAIEEGGGRIYASRRTREHLWVERAATYGFLATDSAQRAPSPEEVWASYKAAREATRMATGRVDSYLPLDIALWMPSRILREASTLSPIQELELKADLRSTLDLVDPSSLDPTHYEMFQRQRLTLADVLQDMSIGDEAFAALDRAGSTVGYYVRARSLAPTITQREASAASEEVNQARAAAEYLRSHYQRISSDVRCLQLLLSMEWLASTKRWLFRGLRQPLPWKVEDRLRIKNVLLDLGLVSADLLQPRFRYLEAVLTWIDGSEDTAIRIWRELDAETKYVEAGRVLSRHILTGEDQSPRLFSGIVERQIGNDRWSLFVETLNRRVDLLADSFKDEDLAVGRTVRGFAIAFNYRGPLADRFAARQANR